MELSVSVILWLGATVATGGLGAALVHFMPVGGLWPWLTGVNLVLLTCSWVSFSTFLLTAVVT